MELLAFAAKIFLAVLAVVGVVTSAYSNWNKLSFAWTIWKRFRPIMLIEVLLLLIATIGT